MSCMQQGGAGRCVCPREQSCAVCLAGAAAVHVAAAVGLVVPVLAQPRLLLM